MSGPVSGAMLEAAGAAGPGGLVALPREAEAAGVHRVPLTALGGPTRVRQIDCGEPERADRRGEVDRVAARPFQSPVPRPRPMMGAPDSTPDATRATRNLLLRALPPEERARLLAHLEAVTLEPMRPIAASGARIPSVHFPETGIISLLSRTADGTLVEHGTVGREGMAGLPLALGVDWTPSVIVGQVPGVSRCLDAGTFAELLPSLPSLAALLQRYAVYLYAQTAQALACNSRHALERRCARWLLMTHDRVEGDAFVLTHEVLAQMLAVRRAGVSEAADALRARGLIAYRRGRVAVVDRAGLEAAACECYGAMRAHRDRLLGPLTL